MQAKNSSKISIKHFRINLIKEAKGSLIAQLIKKLPAMQETLVGFMGQEDPLE